MTRSPERVVVTGIGLVTSLGREVEDVWDSLVAGRSGITPVRSFDTGAFKVHLGGEVPEQIGGVDGGDQGRASRFALAAATSAFGDAGLALSELDGARTGVSMGTTSGEPREVEVLDDAIVAGDLSLADGRFIDRYPCHQIAASVAGEFGLAGPNIMIPTACSAGNYAIGWACDQLQAGTADVMLAGGSDAFSRITYSGFARLFAIAPERVQPFDLNRKGMIPGEGAAVLVLETLARAKKRGARIYAELAGYGISCDAHHMTAAHPEGRGPIRCMEAALAASGLGPGDIDYVSAHGTGTPTNDRIETLAIKSVFGGDTKVAISSVKSMLGHTMGAASAIEAAVCALAIDRGVVPPTINFETADPECELDCVPNQAREMSVKVAMNNAYAFGGNNASVVLRALS